MPKAARPPRLQFRPLRLLPLLRPLLLPLLRLRSRLKLLQLSNLRIVKMAAV